MSKEIRNLKFEIRNYSQRNPVVKSELTGSGFNPMSPSIGYAIREQRDFVGCQRARHAIEDAARENRQGHLRFQELLGGAEDLATELETNPTLRIRLNPIRVWCRFEARALLIADSSTPAEVLFYAMADSIGAAILKPLAMERIRPLCRFGSVTIDEWMYEFDQLAVEERPDRADLIDFCRELVQNGIVALA